MKSISLILANGTKVTTSKDLYPDLFKALRGSYGSTFGIVTSITFSLYNDPGAVSTYQGYYYPSDDTANTFQDWIKSAPNNAHGYYITNYDFVSKSNYVDLSGVCFGDANNCEQVLTPLANIANCAAGSCKISKNAFNSYSDYVASLLDGGESGGVSAFYIVSGALDFSTSGQLAKFAAFQRSYKPEEWAGSVFQCSGNAVLGGASKTMDPGNTNTVVAPAMRNSFMAISCAIGWEQKGEQRADLVQKILSFRETTMRPSSTDGWVYINEPDHDFSSNSDWQSRYWTSSLYQFMKGVKTTYDPNHVLTCYHCVGWEEIENVDPATCPAHCSCSNMKKEGVCAKHVSSASNLYISSISIVLMFLVEFFLL